MEAFGNDPNSAQCAKQVYLSFLVPKRLEKWSIGCEIGTDITVVGTQRSEPKVFSYLAVNPGMALVTYILR